MLLLNISSNFFTNLLTVRKLGYNIMFMNDSQRICMLRFDVGNGIKIPSKYFDDGNNVGVSADFGLISQLKFPTTPLQK